MEEKELEALLESVSPYPPPIAVRRCSTSWSKKLLRSWAVWYVAPIIRGG